MKTREVAKPNGVEATEEPGSSLDRALTLGGYLRSGEYRESTAALYGAAWKAFCSWCDREGRRSLPTTPETMAIYAQILVDSGYSPETVKYHLTAIRARHRITGNQVPDNIPAWSVLSRVKTTPVRARAKGPSDIRQAIAACPDTTIGKRNRALVIVLWDCLVTVPEAIATNVTDVVVSDTGGWLMTTPPRDIAHDHGPAGDSECPNCGAGPGEPCLWPGMADPSVTHTGRVGRSLGCPACAIAEWVDELRSAGIVGGPLFRPVDRLGTIAGTGVPRSGSTAADFRLTVRSVHRIWGKIVREAGMPSCTPRALRLGGAKARVDRGENPLAVIERASWSTNSASVVSRLTL